ncbi:MAG: site-2 protease family protein [Actinomycetota bacterium]
MGDTFRLGRIAGVHVGFHWSLLFIAGLLVVQLVGLLDSDGPSAWLLAVVGAGLFLGSVLLHELGHSVAAQRNGIEVDGISLVFFGGVARLRGEPRTPGAEFRIAAAGPAMNVVLLGVFWALAAAIDGAVENSMVADVFWWLGIVNLILAVFNLLPASPLDGGKILKAGLWRWSGDQARALVLAGRAGQVLGWALVAVSLWRLRVDGAVALWMAMIGWLIIAGAGAEVREGQRRARRQAMGGLPDVVPGLPWPPPHDRTSDRHP